MSDPRRNEEGYLDLTAYHGTKSIIQEENEAGFEIVGRITIKHKKTGRVFIGYLSGPITGHKNYRQQFARAAGTLKEMGYAVINPAELGAALPLDQMSYEDIMKIDMELLATADYLVQLPGWEDSKGANRELGFALGTDKIIVSLEQLLTKEVTPS